MGLGDIAEGIGSAISDGASSISNLPGQAIHFAQGIANRAESFVEDRVGPTGMAMLRTAANIVEGPMGLLPAVINTAVDAIRDPQAFVAGIVARAQSMASTALSFAKNTVSNIIQTTLAGINALVRAAMAGAQLIIQGAVAGIRFAIQGITSGFMAVLRAARIEALSALRFGGKIAKAVAAAYIGSRIAKLLRLQVKLQTLTMRAVALATNVTNRAFGLVRGKINTLALNIHRKATNVVTKTMPTILRVTTRVMVEANRANAFVQNAVNRVRAIMPGGWVGPLAGIARFTQNVAKKATQLHAIYVSTVMPAVLRGYALLETTMWPLVMQANVMSFQAQSFALQQIMMRSQQVLSFITISSFKLQMLLFRLLSKVDGAIDTGISAADAASGDAVEKVDHTVKGIGERVSNALPDTGKPKAHSIGKGIGEATSGVGDLLGLGGVGKKIGSVVDGARRIGNRIIDGAVSIVSGVLEPITHVKQKKLAHDGELTGPFFPQSKEHTPGVGHFDAEARHAQYDEASRRSMLKRGAHIFVNGIDTTLEDHYAAAQRLANELGRPVVGIYNATGGKGNDLLQCASDKLFDRSDNPAVRTLVGILEEQGHKPGKAPRQVFAHSQGSLIVSEALRQAGKGGANLQQYEVTTFGNAAYTFPAGPKYHHYVHDDDLVPTMAGTSSRISHFMNQSRVGRWLSEKVLGKMSDAQKDTTILHHGGAMIGPHGINARKADGTADAPEQKRDYIGNLKQFRAEEQLTAKRTSRQKSIETSVAFSMARGVGEAVSEGVGGAYRRMDTLVKASIPTLPGNVGQSLWNGISSRISSFGQSIYTGGARLGKAHDASFYSRTQTQRQGAIAGGSVFQAPLFGLPAVQRSGAGPKTDADAQEVKTRLDESGEQGISPTSELRTDLAPELGFDPAGARLHTGPAAAQMAGELSARAFTIGTDVYFGAGNYDPASTAGRALIGHELTHVGQQSGLVGNPMRFHSPVGSAADSMEAEAQAVATRIMENAGTPQGVHVQRFEKTYEGEQGVGRTDQQRLDHIGEMALRLAESHLRQKQGRIDLITVEIELDLGAMGDDEAARVWADEIVRQAERAPLRPFATVPVPTRIQRDDKTPTTKERHLPRDIETAIENDVDAIYRELTSWRIDWKTVAAIFERWAALDNDASGRYDSATKHLDYLLVRLQIRTFDKGYVSTQYTTALDEILRKDNSYFSYLKRTEKYKAYHPDDLPESAASYVGRHTLVGVLGIIKALGGAIMGLAQAALWAEWKTSSWKRRAIAYSLEKLGSVAEADVGEYVKFFRSDEPPKADDYVAKCFDDTAKIIVDCMDIDADEKKKMLEDFSFGAKWGAIPANLMMLGAGGGGLTGEGAQALLKTLMVVQTVKGIDDASKALFARVQEIQEKNPNATWLDIVADGEVLKQFATIIVSAIALGTSMAEADSKAKGLLELLKKAGYAGDWAMLGPLFKKAWDDYHLPTKSDSEKAERGDKLQQDAIDIINQIITIGNSTAGRRKEKQQEQQQKQLEIDRQREQERLGRAYESNKQQEAAAAAKAAETSAAPEASVKVEGSKATPEAVPLPSPVAVEPAPKVEEPLRNASEAESAPEPAVSEAVEGAGGRPKSRGYPGDDKTKANTTVTEANGHVVTRDAEGRPIRDVSPNGRVVVWERHVNPRDPSKSTVKKRYEKHRTEVEAEKAAAQKAAEEQAAKAAEEEAQVKKEQEEAAWQEHKFSVQDEVTKGNQDLSQASDERSAAERRVKELEYGRPPDDPELLKAREDLKAARSKEQDADKALSDAEKRMVEERRAKGIPDPKEMDAVLNGTRAEKTAAAKELILRDKSWKEALRKRVKSIGDEQGQKDAGVVFDRARQEIVKEAWNNVLAKHPEMAELKANAPGSPGFNSDIDVGVNPKELPGTTQLANTVKKSAEMVKLMNEELRRMTGGEPDLTLDTNMYSWTGREAVREMVRQNPEARAAEDISSIAEMRRNITDPKAWESLKEQMIAQARAKGGDQAANAIQSQIARGEAMSDALTRSIASEMAKFQQGNERPAAMGDEAWNKIVEMRARESIAAGLREELVKKLQAPKKNRDYARIVELQSQIAMAEPGAYASMAGVDEVVNFGQTLTGKKGEEARDLYMEADRPMTAREAGNSAGSSLAQMEDHAKHSATTKLEADELLKNTVKYAERILNEGRKVGDKSAANAGAPELDQFYRKGTERKARPELGETEPTPTSLKALIEQRMQQELGGNMPPPKTPEYDQAYIAAVNKYAQERLEWARSKVAAIKAEGIVRSLSGQDEEN